MSSGSIFSATSLWAINLFLVLTLSVVGWNVNREYQRNDEQEQRLQAIERTCVKLDFILEDLKEIRADVKILMSRSLP
jgi:hypothetical protein